jgi:coenzyme PQQ synthesis protein D (PqqD)
MDGLGEKFIRNNDSVTRQIAGETIIVPIRGGVGDLGSIYTLNEVGTRIWEMIDGRTSVSRIVETIDRQYDVGTEEAATDIAVFLDSLQAAGLIKPCPAD